MVILLLSFNLKNEIGRSVPSISKRGPWVSIKNSDILPRRHIEKLRHNCCPLHLKSNEQYGVGQFETHTAIWELSLTFVIKISCKYAWTWTNFCRCLCRAGGNSGRAIVLNPDFWRITGCSISKRHNVNSIYGVFEIKMCQIEGICMFIGNGHLTFDPSIWLKVKYLSSTASALKNGRISLEIPPYYSKPFLGGTFKIRIT